MESLRRLLALKRHETPPPGYYNNFSRQVIARIRAGEAELSEGFLARMPWLLRWLQSLEAKPVFAGSFATALCLLLVFGAVMAQRPEPVANALLQPTAARETAAGLPMVATTSMRMSPASVVQPAATTFSESSSTNPVIEFTSDPAGQTPGPQFLTFPMSGN